MRVQQKMEVIGEIETQGTEVFVAGDVNWWSLIRGYLFQKLTWN
jgi:hypothetical protein